MGFLNTSYKISGLINLWNEKKKSRAYTASKLLKYLYDVDLKFHGWSHFEVDYS